tara:strand:+ start:2860 stop:3954 length:1095 start_codon:yes stop_codon:yes gene_type:complete
MASAITSDNVESQFIYTDEPGSAFGTVVYLTNDSGVTVTAGSDVELQDRLDNNFTPVSKSQYSRMVTGTDASGVQIQTVDQYLSTNPQLKGRNNARELVQVFIDEWVNTGSEDLAEDAMYASPFLESAFPGIKDDNGNAIYTISAYTAQDRNYNVALAEKGLNPFLPILQERKADLFKNQVDPQEFSARLDEVRTNVLDNPNKDAVLSQYNEFFAAQGKNIEMTDEALFLLAIAPDVDSFILDERFKIADIGVEASLQGFNLSKGIALDLYERGYDMARATELFGTASSALSQVMRAQAQQAGVSPESIVNAVNIQDYLSAFVDMDADAITTFTRLGAIGESLSTTATGASTTETGQVVGLIET